jgi:hypothetical protein
VPPKQQDNFPFLVLVDPSPRPSPKAHVMAAGGVAKTAEEAYAAAKSLNSNNMVLKAQVAFLPFDLPLPRSRFATWLRRAPPPDVSGTKGGLTLPRSQVLAGGRGLGTFDNGFKGGVHVGIKTPEEVRDMAAKMLNAKLITKQTGAGGRICNTVQVIDHSFEPLRSTMMMMMMMIIIIIIMSCIIKTSGMR